MNEKTTDTLFNENVRVLTVAHTHAHCCFTIIWSSYAVERKLKRNINEEV